FHTFADDVRGDKNHELFLLLEAEGAGKELADEWYVSEDRNLGVVPCVLGLDQTAEHDGVAVMHADQRRGLLGVEVWRGRGGGASAAAAAGAAAREGNDRLQAGEHRRDVE